MAAQPIGKQIIDGTDFWKNDNTSPIPVRHFFLTMQMIQDVGESRSKSDGDGGSVHFKISEVNRFSSTNKAPLVEKATVEEMEKYVSGVVIGKPIRGDDPSTPYDIQICKQSWILLQLDDRINWRFSSEYFAVSQKEDDPAHEKFPAKKRFNSYLRHGFANGKVVADPTAVSGKSYCRHVFFGAFARNKDQQQLFNICVEFFQLDSGGFLKTLPLIIDPDVGNDGNEAFP